MASGSANRVYHSTLAAATVDTVTLNFVCPTVRVTNRGTTDIFLTVDGTTPAVAAAETYVVPASTDRVFDTGKRAEPASASNPTSVVVKLISSGTPAYSVAGV